MMRLNHVVLVMLSAAVLCVRAATNEVAELPNVGLLKVHDAETGREQVVDTSSAAVRRAHAVWWKSQGERLRDTFNRSNVDAVSIRTDQDYVAALMSLFARRS